jgi:predicted ATP-grasp superfamily ATP-dependent carboligase
MSAARRGIIYPCIIKPGWRNEAWQRQHGNDKVVVVNNPDELLDRLRSLYDRFEHLVVQEIVPGSERNIVCSFTYLTEESEPLGIFTSGKIRQFPPNFGNSSLVQQVSEPQVVALTVRICKQLGLVGYASIEFKKDERDGTYKVIEITPCRFNRQAGLADAAGLCLPYVWYCHVLRRPIDAVVKSGNEHGSAKSMSFGRSGTIGGRETIRSPGGSGAIRTWPSMNSSQGMTYCLS